jgi:hypothetical protein
VTIERSEFKALIAGMILGDGCVYIQKAGKNACFKLQHGPKQKDYLLYKAEILKELTEVRLGETKPNGKKNPNVNYTAETRVHPLYTRIREIVYPKGKRTVNKIILSWLNEQGLAIWYMDDGSLIKSYRLNKGGNRIIYRRELFLNTCAFNLEEHQLLQTFFLERFGIKFDIKLTSKKSGFYRLRAGALEANKFIEIVKPYIVPSMEYKIDMQYQ